MAEYDPWTDFANLTGIERRGRFAGKHPYELVFRLCYPTRNGVLLKIIREGSRVGLTGADFRSDKAFNRDLRAIHQATFFAFPGMYNGHRETYCSFYGIVWSDDWDDLHFVREMQSFMPWRDVCRRSESRPYGVIDVVFNESKMTFQPKDWMHRGRGRWVPTGQARQQVCKGV